MILPLAVTLVIYLVSQTMARARHHRWLRQVSLEFSEMLESMTQALKAGSAFLQALRVSADHTQPPLRDELRGVLKQYELGLPIETCLEGLAARIPLHEIPQLNAALRLSQQSGGSLASLLERMSQNLREQLRLEQRVISLASQGKMQAYVMFALPYLLLATLYLFEADLMRTFFQGPYGQPLLAFLVVTQSIALVWIQRILEVRL